MNGLHTRPIGPTPVGEGPPRPLVLLVYEDFETGLRARQTLEQAVQGLDIDMQFNLWRFDLFGEPGLRQPAADQAAAADIVFLSAHGWEQLPATVTQWFQSWFGRRGSDPSALAVSLDAGAKATPTATHMVEVLDAGAGLAGVDMFLHFGQAQGQLESAIESVRHRAETSTIILEEFLRQSDRNPFRHWGINE